MIWFQKDKIPDGSWPFLNTTYLSLREIETTSCLIEVDLTEGQGDITISGCMEAYRQIVIRRVLDLVQSVVVTWNSQNYVGSLICSRALLETLAVFYSFITRAKQAIDNEEWDVAYRLVTAYSFSTAQGTNKKKKTSEHPPRIRELVIQFIRDQQPGCEQFWEKICDYAHPNGKPMFNCFGELRSKHLYVTPKADLIPSLFVVIYNCIYSVCWFSCAMDDYDIYLKQLRLGAKLPESHPLIIHKKLVDSVVEQLEHEIKRPPVGPHPKKS